MKRALIALSIFAAAIGTYVQTATASPSHAVITETLSLAKPFTPVAPVGGHDLYHCELLNPHVTGDMMVTKSSFTPGVLAEDHHAIAYLVAPSQAATARSLDQGGKGWTCFGGPGLSSSTQDNLGSAPWLAVWTPGHGPTVQPAGTGVSLPAGSLIILQIHFNLLTTHKPDKSSLSLTMVPAAGSGLIAMNTLLLPAPVDIPCPAGVTGDLCSRAAALADIGKRFGPSAVGFDNGLEYTCHHGVAFEGVTATCTWPIQSSQYIWQVTPHMHLLGTSFTAVLDAGTSRAQTLVNVPAYDFHYQTSHPEATPIFVTRGDSITLTCTYDPTLRQSLSFLKSLPARYILWGDGSTDEMCLGIFGVTSSLAVSPHVQHQASHVLWPAAIAKAAAQISIMGMLGTSDVSPAQTLADVEAMVRVGFCAPE
jgi:Copper type II ascorbate-dependent monooxygenase, C-terminal domain